MGFGKVPWVFANHGVTFLIADGRRIDAVYSRALICVGLIFGHVMLIGVVVCREIHLYPQSI